MGRGASLWGIWQLLVNAHSCGGRWLVVSLMLETMHQSALLDFCFVGSKAARDMALVI